MQPFTTEQKHYITLGEEQVSQLRERVSVAFERKRNKVVAKRHHYIVGPAGIGKSFTVKETAAQYDVTMLELIGAPSMNAIATQLATAVFEADGEKIYVWIDDCDSIFSEREHLSIMKGALDEDRNIFSWNKNLTVQIQNYESSSNPDDNAKGRALRHFQVANGVGIEVPTDNVNFIITSNHELAPSTNPIPKQARKIDEAAIRDRVSYASFACSPQVSWGWSAYVLLNNRVFDFEKSRKDLTKGQKMILLHWLYENWGKLSSTSMRTIKELAGDMLNYPQTYVDHWKFKLN